MSQDALRQSLHRGPACPELDVLFSLAEKPDTVAASLQSHIAGCAACQTELSLYREFVEPQWRPGEHAAVDQIVSGLVIPLPKPSDAPKAHWWQSFPKPVWLGSAALACAALLLTVGITVQRNSNPAFPSRVRSEGDVTRSPALSITSPVGDLAQVPKTIEWAPVPGAATYVVTISEVDRNQIFYRTVTTRSLPLPAATATLISPGKTVFLEVTAKDVTGNRIATSGQQRIRVGFSGH
jgi:hypothetical protein